MTDTTQKAARPPADRGGFTLIEVIIAIVILAVGVMALLGSSAMVTRMIGAGKHSTQAVEVATRRLENLRRIAYSTTPPCTDGNFASGTATGTGYTEAWTVSADAGNPIRTVADTITYTTTRGNAVLGLESRILCR
jgi:prepilin-type N-terminal cleavage/methylation domain-containing protein